MTCSGKHQEHIDWVNQGSAINLAEAEAFEQSLLLNPYDLSARFHLMGYYLAQLLQGFNCNQARASNVVWLIDNVPDCPLIASQYGMLSRDLDPEAFEEARRHFLTRVEGARNNCAVIGNAAEFFAASDPVLSEKLFRDAIALAPADPLWSRQLAFKLANAGASRAAEAYDAMHAALALENEPQMQYHMLDTLAELAWQVGKNDEAFDAALECLTRAFSYGPDDHDGNAIYNSNCVMGLVCLEEGDPEAAQRHLILAGETPGSARLALAPNMTLAAALLRAGHKECVLQFLDSCEKFWTLGRDMGLLKEWTAEIESGGPGDFMHDFVKEKV